MSLTTEDAVNAVRSASKDGMSLSKSEFALTNGVGTNKRTEIASYQADTPLVLNDQQPLMLALTAYDGFTTDGSAANQETFNLSHDLVDTPNTEDLILFEAGNRVNPDSVDYANNSFSYTDDGTNNALHAYYIPSDATDIEIVKQAPSSEGRIEQRVYDASTALIHRTNLFKDGEAYDSHDAANPLKHVVPAKWDLVVYAKGDYAVTWDDSEDATNGSDGTTAENALFSLPVAQLSERIDGLSGAVRADITG